MESYVFTTSYSLFTTHYSPLTIHNFRLYLLFRSKDMNKRWALKDTPDHEEVNSLPASLTIDPTLSTLLIDRGIRNYDEARLFFRPDNRHLHDPFLMAD